METDEVNFGTVPEWHESEPRHYDMREPELTAEEMLLEQLAEDQMPVPATVEKVEEADEPAEVTIKSVIFRTQDAFEIADFELSAQVRILRRNHGGKLLRLRIIPALNNLDADQITSLEGRFDKFSLHQTDKYTEMVFAAPGRVGDPYTAMSDDGSFRFSIPYQTDLVRFPLLNGEPVADGVTRYQDRYTVAKRTSDVHVLRVEPFSNSIKTFPVLANDGIAQKETLSSMAKRYNAVAGINGAYFTANGDSIGTLIINRHLISSPLYKRSVFGITDEDTIVFGNPDFSGVLRSAGKTIAIDAVNQPRGTGNLVVFTSAYARSTMTRVEGTELVLVRGRIVGIHKKDALIPPDGVVVSAGGTKAVELAQFRLGQRIELDYSIDKPWNMIKHAVCGGPRLVSDGEVDINGKEEKFSASIVSGRHPRTAIGLTFDGDLLMVVVDGRSKRSAGMTLKELADYLRKLGVRHAINLDGGGSSSMFVKGKTINRPSDGRERRISNGILITGR